MLRSVVWGSGWGKREGLASGGRSVDAMGALTEVPGCEAKIGDICR